VTASLTPWIAQRYGWTTSFAIAAALAVFSAICWMTVHPERPLVIEPSPRDRAEIGMRSAAFSEQAKGNL
jgi:predicted MFS family arabinose efflux permease